MSLPEGARRERALSVWAVNAMPMRICNDCGKLSHGTRCDPCATVKRRASNARYRPHAQRRPGYGSAERERRAATVAAWRQAYGELCPGWQRPAHMADPKDNPLTADHLQSVRSGGMEAGPLGVLCRSCNSRKGSHSVTGDGG